MCSSYNFAKFAVRSSKYGTSGADEHKALN
jgi:hypothetical protein